MLSNCIQRFSKSTLANVFTHKNTFKFSLSEVSSSKPYISKLTNRSLLILNGPETYKYLQI